MAKAVEIEVKDRDVSAALRGFLTSVLEQEAISAMLVPWRLPMGPQVTPTLVTDSSLMARAAPLSPAFPLNAAALVSKLTRKASGGRIAAVLRPCEIRAFTERVKLKQGRREEVLIIGIDCLGALTNTDYAAWATEDDHDAGIAAFVSQSLAGGNDAAAAPPLAEACRVCEAPIPQGADLSVALYGVDTDRRIIVEAHSEDGETVLAALGRADAKMPAGRNAAVETLVSARLSARDRMFEDTHAATGDLEHLTRYLAGCINCYNCRNACPVCFCKTCVFTTDVFDHEPLQYLRWAARKGAVKMPTDTVFYHLTRLAHMGAACVGCGQCANACPNDVPVMALFRTASHPLQAAFEYSPGRSLEEMPPMSVFKEDEFTEIVGIT